MKCRWINPPGQGIAFVQKKAGFLERLDYIVKHPSRRPRNAQVKEKNGACGDLLGRQGSLHGCVGLNASFDLMHCSVQKLKKQTPANTNERDTHHTVAFGPNLEPAFSLW